MNDPKAILIGGTSHTGKSTLARRMGLRLGWAVMPTDTLARHPGRPWPQNGAPVRPHVANHYLTLSTGELIADVQRHYASLRPVIESKLAASAGGLVVEGSALWPEHVTGPAMSGARSIWLTAGEDFLRKRIFTESGHARADRRQQAMIASFADRTVAFDRLLIECAEAQGQPVLNIETAASPEDALALALECLKLTEA